MKERLIKLGLTPNEATVYLALVELGESPAGAIIKKTNKHRSIVYESLDKLVQEGLVAAMIKKGKKFFQITNPEIITVKIKDRLHLAEELTKQIKRKNKSKAPRVNIYEGKDGWQTAYRRITKELKKRNKVYTLGAGADKWVEAMGDFFVEYEKFCQQNNIQIIMLAYSLQKKEIEAHQSHLIRKVRYLPKKFVVPSNTEIFPDRIFIQIYTSPLILIEIGSKEVADGYRQHFHTLWELAKK